VADSSRYDVFSLIDAAVGQDHLRTLKIVRGLQLEGTELLYVTAMLARELRGLASMAYRVRQGQTVDAAIQGARVWPKRKSIVAKCLQRHPLQEILGLQAQVSRIDKMVKGIGDGDPWTELTDVMLTLSGRSPVSLAAAPR